MTVATVTICGVVLEAGDWPEDGKYFSLLNNGQHGFKDSPWVGPLVIEDAKWAMGYIAAVARCWFLDKAQEADYALPPQPDRMMVSKEVMQEWRNRVKAIGKLHASAAKWAQIGRNACKQ